MAASIQKVHRSGISHLKGLYLPLINQNPFPETAKRLNGASYNERRLSTKKNNSFQYCVESVRKHDYENYLCTLLLPEQARTSSFIIRAFNVEISQVRDSVSNQTIGEMRMQFWKDTLDKIFAGNPPEQPIAQEISRILRTTNLSKSWFQRLIVGRENLLSDKPFLSVKELEDYCDQTVVPIFFLILQASGISDVNCDHAASHIGKSQGICNFLRGIPYNLSKGRLFLPIEIMSKYKISHEELHHGKGKEKLQDAVFELSSLANQHLVTARKLSKDLSKAAKHIFLPWVPTAAYLKNLEKINFDVFHPKVQQRNNLLPTLLLYNKWRNTF